MTTLPRDNHSVLNLAYDQRFQLYTGAGDSADLRNHFLDQPVALLCGGPSLAGVDHEKLRNSGIVTMAMNNAWSVYRPDLWVCVDPASTFLDTGWKDPRILKFAPTSEIRTRLRQKRGGDFASLGMTPGRAPNTLFFKRSVGFQAHTFLTQPTANYGQKGGRLDFEGMQGSRSVMLAALRILHYLGFRRVYLFGADFQMESEGPYYAAGETQPPAAVAGNQHTFAVLNSRFKALRPHFDAADFQVFNATPGSRLDAFENIEPDAVFAKEHNPGPQGGDAVGWYAKHNVQRSSELDHYLNRAGGPYSTWHQRVYAAAASLVPHGAASVLDIGCGVGAGHDILRRSGWVGAYTGIDIEPRVPGVDSHPDLPGKVCTGDFMVCELDPADIVLCVEVFEHLQCDPTAAATRLLSLTRHTLILSTPDVSKNPHGRFTTRQMEDMLSAAGADVFSQPVGGTVVYLCRKRPDACNT